MPDHYKKFEQMKRRSETNSKLISEYLKAFPSGFERGCAAHYLVGGMSGHISTRNLKWLLESYKPPQSEAK